MRAPHAIYEHKIYLLGEAMEDYKKEQNSKFFSRIIEMTNDGGTYVWPSEARMYTIKNNQIVGDQESIDAIKAITLESFYSKLKVEGKTK